MTRKTNPRNVDLCHPSDPCLDEKGRLDRDGRNPPLTPESKASADTKPPAIKLELENALWEGKVFHTIDIYRPGNESVPPLGQGHFPAATFAKCDKDRSSNHTGCVRDGIARLYQSHSTLWNDIPTEHLCNHTIPAAHGFALTLKPGARLRIVDLHGQQVVDFMAWALPFQPDSSCEHFSASYTRYRLGGSAPPQVGECLYSNRDRTMFEILEDKVKCHDMLFMACNPSFYERLGKKEHRSCAGNIAEAMGKEGFELVEGRKGSAGWSGVHDPFNVFQNTPYYTLKALECSREGDWIEMRVSEEMEHGVVVALSSCPYEENGFNGGKVTDVQVIWEKL